MRSLLDKNWFLILIISILTLSVYSYKLSAPFDGMDDQVLIVGNEAIQNNAHLGEIFIRPFFLHGSYFRPGVLLNHMAEYRWFGLNPFFYNLNPVLLPIFNAILVFLIAQFFFQKNVLSFFVSVLFALHPINWEAVAMISGRPILLCAFFYLSGFWAYINFIKDPKAIVLYLLTIICFVFGMFCKEEMIVLPVLLALYDWMWNADTQKNTLNRCLRLLPFGLIIIVYFLWRQSIHVAKIFLWANFSDGLKGVATFLWSLVLYAKTFVLPLDIYYDRSERYITEFGDLRFGIAVLVLIGGLSIVYTKRFEWSRKVKYFIGWVILTLIPVSQLVPINVQMGSASVPNHFFYLPSVGIFILSVHGLNRLYVSMQEHFYGLAKYSRVLMEVVLIIFVFITLRQNLIAAQPSGVFRQTLYYEPGNIRVRHGLALQYVQNRQWLEAERQFRIITTFDPMNIGARISLGRVLFEEKRYAESSRILESIQDAGPFQEILKINKKVLEQHLK